MAASPDTAAPTQDGSPSPKSPPKYPDFCGRHRLHVEVQILNREITFLESIMCNFLVGVAFSSGGLLSSVFKRSCNHWKLLRLFLDAAKTEVCSEADLICATSHGYAAHVHALLCGSEGQIDVHVSLQETAAAALEAILVSTAIASEIAVFGLTVVLQVAVARDVLVAVCGTVAPAVKSKVPATVPKLAAAAIVSVDR
ncbi:hypothetical protein HPP92_016602 [Vanilla planifolia]|uniref:Uncharacterized protein n=1 Tax=Vanilla planifolia TaxID=51239 RepID=A0A835QLH8_VANPL|nr:hypothetical protein HPP92_016602 [Vanilla planifolia]